MTPQIVKVTFIKSFKRAWKVSNSNKAGLHNNGVEFHKDGKRVSIVPYQQIKEIHFG